MSTVKHSPYIIIGAGIHGLSTAYHLALELKARGKGSGRDIIVVDKTGVSAGATAAQIANISTQKQVTTARPAARDS